MWLNFFGGMVVKSKILKSFIAAFLILCSFSFFHSPSQKAQAFGECIFSPIVIYGKGMLKTMKVEFESSVVHLEQQQVLETV